MIALGHGLGDDGRSMISLHPEVLQAAAMTTTGLDDFGDDWWEEPFRRLCSALDSEAQLHLPGRLRTRGVEGLLVHVEGRGPLEEAERIFDKFYRSEDPRVEKITGTGLGLTLAREVVRLHGGDVTLQSELNRGSTFTATFPVPAEAA